MTKIIRLAIGTFRQIARAVVYGLIGAFVVLLVVSVYSPSSHDRN